MNRAPAGEAAGYQWIVLPHLDAAYNLARWLTRDAVLAQDVVQDAALRALRYFPSFRGGDGRAWFMRIVRNAAHETLASRHHAATDTLDDELPGDPADNPEAALGKRQDGEALARALAALPVELRECLCCASWRSFPTSRSPRSPARRSAP